VKILNTPEIKKEAPGQGAEFVGDTPEQFATFIREVRLTTQLGLWIVQGKSRAIAIINLSLPLNQDAP
jgi:hypothetical protein